MALHISALAFALLLAVSLAFLGHSRADYALPPPCELSKFNFLTPSMIDLNKFEGTYYKKYGSYNLGVLFDGLQTDIIYHQEDDGNVTLFMRVTQILTKEDDCHADGLFACTYESDGLCYNGTDNYYGIVGIDYDSNYGSFVTYSEIDVYGQTYPILTIFVKNPYVHPGVVDLLASVGVAEICDSGVEDPMSDFYTQNLDYAQTPDCFNCNVHSCPAK